MSDPNKEAEGEEEEEDKYKNLTDEMKDEITECFEIFDKDKDGQINFVDLTNLLRWLKFNPTEREMKEYMEKHDPQKSNMVNKKTVYDIVDRKVLEPDTIEELIEAMKVFDYNRDGTIAVPELRWAMTKLGDCLDEISVDEMIKEIDNENKGFVNIIDFAKICFNIKEKKAKD